VIPGSEEVILKIKHRVIKTTGRKRKLKSLSLESAAMSRTMQSIDAEVNIEKRAKASTSLLSGVEEHGMLDIGNRRQPGRAYATSKGTEYVGQGITNQERQMSVGSRITA